MDSSRYTFHAFGANRGLLAGLEQNTTHVDLSLESGAAFQLRITTSVARDSIWQQPWLHLTHNRRCNESGRGVLSPGVSAESLCVSVGPQKATTLAEYRQGANAALKGLWKQLEREQPGELGDDMVFDHEWWRYCDYKGVLDESLLPALKSVFPMLDGMDLETLGEYNSMDIVSRNGNELIMELHYGNITTLQFPKGSFIHDSVSELALLLEVDPQDESYDRSLEGVRGKLEYGKELKLIPTLVFPMPQHVDTFGWTASHEFISPYGLHPLYNVSLSDNRDQYHPFKPMNGCSLKFTMDIPKQLFVDKYQLQGLIGRHGDLTCVSNMEMSNNGAVDLELPDYEVKEYGSTLHLNMDPECVIQNNGFQIPFHLRYAAPNQFGSQLVKIAPGDLYWKCELDADSDEWISISSSFLFQDDHLGITKLDNIQSARYYHVPTGEKSNLTLSIPVAQITHLKPVEFTTLLLVVLGTLTIFYNVFKVHRN